MQDLTALPNDVLARLIGVLTDIDDTLTTDGHLTAAAYEAMERLQKAGLLVVPITGRPAGWCDHIARMWPVDGVVGENGAFFFRYLHDERRMIRRFLDDETTRRDKRARLATLRDKILATVPGTALASDQPYREADLAIDYCEDVPRLAPESVDRIVELFEEAGAIAKVSSIHVNGWFGGYDKLSMSRIFFDEAFGIDLDAERTRFVFVGDSPNDGPMFQFFPHAIGVANLRDFEGRIDHLPRYITDSRGGAGFAEVAEALLASRRELPGIWEDD